MKQVLHFLLIAFLCSCISLENHILDSKPKTELEKLPPATHEGKGTFGCLINGKAWYATASSYAPADYQSGSLSLSGAKDNPSESIGIDLVERKEDPALSTGSYSLLPTAQFNPFITAFKFNCRYGGNQHRGDVVSGELNIKKFDKVNYIVSGSFEFTLTHSGCDTLKITQGRFDIKYAP